ncbi:MAG: hypothetical protein KC549_19005, partial [Myxococcales bacterium]|nr:hypothetical protein [Myxococcales bacterium]
DLIILDPPSTSTGPRKKRWSAARDYPELVALALPLLRPGGCLWTVTNHRATPAHRFARKVAEALPEGSTLERACPPPVDYPVDGPFPVKTLWWRVPG